MQGLRAYPSLLGQELYNTYQVMFKIIDRLEKKGRVTGEDIPAILLKGAKGLTISYCMSAMYMNCLNQMSYGKTGLTRPGKSYRLKWKVCRKYSKACARDGDGYCF